MEIVLLFNMSCAKCPPCYFIPITGNVGSVIHWMTQRSEVCSSSGLSAEVGGFSFWY